MSFIADAFTGAGGAADEARAAAQGIQFQPFNVLGSSLGSIRGSGDDIRIRGGSLEQQFTRPIQGTAQQLLGGALAGGPFGAAGVNLQQLDQALRGIRAPGPTADTSGAPGPTTTVGGPGATVSGVQQFGGLADLLQSGRGALGAAGAAREALGSFDPDAFAGTQFERLNALAQPQEQTAATQLLERLHGTGRLAVTEAGQQRELTELATSQEMGRNQRLLQAVGLAGQEQDRLAQQAGMFGRLGQGLVTGAGQLQQSGQRLGLGAEQALFDQLMGGARLRTQQQGQLFGQQMAGRQFESGQAGQLFQQLMGGAQFGQQQALSRFGAAQEALGAGQRQQGQDIGQALQLLSGLQQIQSSPLALLNQSIGAGALGMEAGQARAGMIADAAQQEAASRSQFFSGLASAAGNIFSFGI